MDLQDRFSNAVGFRVKPPNAAIKRRERMSSNFKIISHRTSETLHLKLVGDFDGTSACQLINSLKKRSNGCRKVIIHTNCRNKIHPFGLQTFHKTLADIKGGQIHLIFTGENADQISPEKAVFSS